MFNILGGGAFDLFGGAKPPPPISAYDYTIDL